MSGVEVCDSRASILGNRLHENQTGVMAHANATGTIADNEIWANAINGVELKTGAGPAVVRNTIKGNASAGVHLNEASGRVSSNQIVGNVVAGIWFASAPKPGSTLVVGNHVHDHDAGAFRGVVATGAWGPNDLGFSQSAPAELGAVADAIEAGELDAADKACKTVLRAESGVTKFTTKELAAKAPADLLKRMDALWHRATGIGLRGRDWVVSESDITAMAFINTYLAKRLSGIGL
jgi:hypothetical protein